MESYLIAKESWQGQVLAREVPVWRPEEDIAWSLHCDGDLKMLEIQSQEIPSKES